MSCPIDHPILDVIFNVMPGEGHAKDISRMSERIEFRDGRDARTYEIVVREIDGLYLEAQAALERQVRDAAHNLLEACKAAREELRYMGRLRQSESMQLVDAAIAKAEPEVEEVPA